MTRPLPDRATSAAVEAVLVAFFFVLDVARHPLDTLAGFRAGGHVARHGRLHRWTPRSPR